MTGERNEKWNAAAAFLTKRATGVGMLMILLVLGFRATLFFAPGNLMDVLKQGSVLTMIAMGITVVLVGGGFDMGAGALVQLTCNLAAGMILAGLNPWLSLPMGLLAGLLMGLVNAFLVTVVNIPTFVATLGTMFVAQGLTTLYNDGQALSIKAQGGFTFLSQGYVLGTVPMLFLIVVVVCAALNFFLKRTRTGLRMYAVGENPAAAMLRGVNRTKYLVIAYAMSGAILGFTGVLQCSYTYGASAAVSGMDFLIQALSAAYLGSTFSRTGELSIIGTAFSGIFIAALSNALIINGISNQQISGILGLILILSILITVIKKRDIGQVTIF